MTGTVSRGFLNELERRREQIRAAAENMLLDARSSFLKERGRSRPRLLLIGFYSGFPSPCSCAPK